MLLEYQGQIHDRTDDVSGSRFDVEPKETGLTNRIDVNVRTLDGKCTPLILASDSTDR